jgi:hypothetical protein
MRGKSKARAALARKLRLDTQWFNQRRLDDKEWRPDLSHMQFDHANLEGVNMSGLNLRYANFSSCNLAGANLKAALVTFTNFNGAILKNADLRGAKNLTKAQLEAAKDASGLQYDLSTFKEPTLKGDVPRVFLSYAWADKDAVLAVDQWLRDKGARVIIDDRNFIAGESIRGEILRWINEAGVIVCFVSSNSKDRPYPDLEREIAETLRIKGRSRVIYFSLDDTIIDIVQEGRLYVPGHRLVFDEACETLWSGIKESVRPAKAVDLRKFRSIGTDWAKPMPPK